MKAATSFQKMVLFLLILLVAKFCAIEFTFTPITMNIMENRVFSPKLKKLKMIKVGPINSHVKTNLNLVEFILLDMDFNYLKSVPSYKRLSFSLPDI